MIPIVEPVIEEYARNHSIAPDPLLQELTRYTYEHCDIPQMVTGEPEAALLKMLIALTTAKRVLEIGMFTGYSALSMAEAMPKDGVIISCDINPETTAIAQGFFDRSPHGHKIDARLGPALEAIGSLPKDPPFDLAFIDADKENYSNYYDGIWPLIRNGGLIVADNALWSGRVLAPQEPSDHAIVAFNQKVQQDPKAQNVLLTVRDGVMLIRKLAN